MKKLLVTLFALASVGNAFAGYKIEMKNDVKNPVRVDISYIGGQFGICKSDSVTLQSGEYKSIDIGICCVSRIVVTPLAGMGADLPVEYMKVSNSCGGLAFTITQEKWGHILFEQGASLPRQGTGSRKNK